MVKSWYLSNLKTVNLEEYWGAIDWDRLELLEKEHGAIRKMLLETGDLVGSNFHHRGTLHNIRKAEDVSFDNPFLPVPKSKMSLKGSPRFGMLSRHSFFSRHNPHPNRVTHMRGLNGNPVCIVNDDWHVSTPLSPHPFIKSQIPWPTYGSPAIQIPFLNFSGSNAAHHNTETWREELKDLAAKVIMSASANKDEKTVLELLCQILQTDSLSHVQHWLLHAGQREKDMVMCLLQKALDGSALNCQEQPLNQAGTPHSPLSLPSRASSTSQHWINHRLSSAHPVLGEISAEEKAERVGTAEVLRVHSSDHGENNIPGSTSSESQL